MLLSPSDIFSASVLLVLTPHILCVCAYVHGVHECALCEHACGGQRSTSGIIIKELFLILFFETGSLSILEFAK